MGTAHPLSALTKELVNKRFIIVWHPRKFSEISQKLSEAEAPGGVISKPDTGQPTTFVITLQLICVIC